MLATEIMLNQPNLIKLALLSLLFISCSTQPGKVEFPLAETEFNKPKSVKAVPTIHQIPENLPNAKYTTAKGQLIKRDPSIPLKTAVKKTAGQPRITENRLKKSKIPTNLNKRLAGTPQKREAKGKTVLARGKVVMAGKPISKPYNLPDVRDNDNYGFRNISQDQNLPGTIAYALLEDSQGRIWVGTDNGLAILEGGELKIYTTHEGLSNNNVRSLLQSSTGAIWIGTDGGGVSVFESGIFTHYGAQEGLSSNYVYSLLESSTGAIWIGTDGGGVDVFESGSFTNYGTAVGLSNNNIVYSLLESSTGAIWIGTYGGGVDVFESGSFTHYGTEEGLSSNRIFSLFQSSTGAIWIGTDGAGIDVFELGSFTHYGAEEGLSSNRVFSILESTKGAIWIGSYGGGVDVFESGSLTHYGTEEGLSDNYIFSLLESSSGTIWIGTSGGGVDFFESGHVTHYGTEEGLKRNTVNVLLESAKGAIWIGSYGGGVDVFKSDSFTHYGTAEGLSSNTVLSLLESSTGGIWIGTYGGGVDVFESGSFTHYGTGEGLSSNTVSSLLESSTGAIWIGTDGGGVNVFESGSFTHYGTAEGLSGNTVRSLLESTTGAIWIGTDGGGVNVFESGSFTHYGTADGLSSNNVWSLLESSTGAIWIGTYGGGVDVFESGNFTHYGTAEGLADNSVLQLAMDRKGDIWAGTSKGLTRFVAKEDSYELTSWNKTHGLKDMDFNGPGNPMLFTQTDKVSKKGTMWSGIGQALTAFESPLADTLKPTLFLTGIDIAQKPINWSGISDVKKKRRTMVAISADTLFFSDPDKVLVLSNSSPDTSALTRAGVQWSGVEELAPYHLPQNLELPYGQDHLTFHYSGMKLSEQFDVVYRYMLEGMDKNWSTFTKEGKVDYRNIPSGQYTFSVRARGRNFLWSEEKSFSFVVHPPWWLSGWAKFFYGVFVVVLLVIIVKLNTYRLVKQKKQLEQTVNRRTAEVVQQKEEIEIQAKTLLELNETKDKLFSIIGHDLKGPIDSLWSFIYLLRNQIDAMTKEQIRLFVIDLDNSQKNMSALLENLLSWSLSQSGTIQFIPEEFDLTALLKENEELLNTQAANKYLTLQNNATEKLIIRAHKNSIATVVRNLISNAIKFTPENGKITLGWEQKNKEVVVTVTDTGVGMSPDRIKKIFLMGTSSSNLGTAEEKGTGLGLMLCKEFVEKNGGKIWVISEVNVGSKFMFSIPINV